MEKTKYKYPYIVITGPESTGKTDLAQQLAHEYQCNWIPELSREFIANLGRAYTYSDVALIAQQQIEQLQKYGKADSPFVIFDTGLIITKVWFKVVFQQCPEYLLAAIEQLPKIPHLVCNTDLPWIPDSVRENGGNMREKLLETYINELNFYEFPFQIISGMGTKRLQHAMQVLQNYGVTQ
jgi:nicotinamide riboside kinase